MASVTAAASAASTAVPPASNASSPARVAARWGVAIANRIPRAPSSAISGSEREPAVAVDEPRGPERVRGRALMSGETVDPLEGDRSDPCVLRERGDRVDPSVGLGEGEERSGPAFQERGELAAGEDRVGPGGARGATRAARPGQGRAVRLRRIARRDGDGFVRSLGRRLAELAEPVDRAGEGELRGAEPLDEVPAPSGAGLLHRAQHRVDARVPARDTLGEHRLARHHAVALEELERAGVGDLGRARGGLAPPAGGGGTGGGGVGGGGARPGALPARRGGRAGPPPGGGPALPVDE